MGRSGAPGSQHLRNATVFERLALGWAGGSVAGCPIPEIARLLLAKHGQVAGRTAQIADIASGGACPRRAR
eukprot:13211464-Alexandrium_andersonii.AAC.2